MLNCRNNKKIGIKIFRSLMRKDILVGRSSSANHRPLSSTHPDLLKLFQHLTRSCARISAVRGQYLTRTKISTYWNKVSRSPQQTASQCLGGCSGRRARGHRDRRPCPRQRPLGNSARSLSLQVSCSHHLPKMYCCRSLNPVTFSICMQ